jgi:hypothetical protein
VGYLLKAVAGAALFLGGTVLFNVKLLALLETGTCASGNVPYEIAPGYECPEGTGTDIALLLASIIGGLIGAAIFAFRGRPPWGSSRRRIAGIFGFGTFAWGLFFSATGATALIAGLTDETLGADAELGALIVGATFLLMGLPALLISLWGLVKGLVSGEREGRVATPAAPAGDAGVLSRMRRGLAQASGAQQIGARMGWGPPAAETSAGGAGDAIERIERLQRLRESGALTQAEFEREKARVLAEPTRRSPGL